MGSGRQAAWSSSMPRSDASGAPLSADDTKLCPYCAETIKAAAVKCRYCHSDLTELATTLPAESRVVAAPVRADTTAPAVSPRQTAQRSMAPAPVPETTETDRTGR